MVGVGRVRRRSDRRVRSSSIVDGSGGIESGEVRGWLSVRRERVWWVRWVERAEWEVMSLYRDVLSARHNGQYKYFHVPCRAILNARLRR